MKIIIRAPGEAEEDCLLSAYILCQELKLLALSQFKEILKNFITTDNKSKTGKSLYAKLSLRRDRMLIIHSVLIAITITKATWFCL